jgi:DNA polymerase-4
LGWRQRPLEEVFAVLIALVDRVAGRLRASKRLCRTVVLRMRFSDHVRATRSHTMPQPTASTTPLLAVAGALVTASLPEIQERGLTLIGISLTNLIESPLQLTLSFDRSRELDMTLDSIRKRFGQGAITRAVLLGRKPGEWIPLLPD